MKKLLLIAISISSLTICSDYNSDNNYEQRKLSSDAADARKHLYDPNSTIPNDRHDRTSLCEWFLWQCGYLTDEDFEEEEPEIYYEIEPIKNR